MSHLCNGDRAIPAGTSWQGDFAVMKRFAIAVCAGLLTVSTTAAADPPHGRGKGKDKHEYKYEEKYENGRFEREEKFESRGVAFQRGGPPPWAPAHGYRRKQAEQGAAWAPPFGIDAGRCNRDMVGGLLGAAAGGLAGSNIGDGTGQKIATAAGTLAGFLIGSAMGRSLDAADVACMGQVLEYAPERQPIAWDSPQGQWRMIPTATTQVGGTYCREYQTFVTIGGRTENAWGRACRQPDGSWRPEG